MCMQIVQHNRTHNPCDRSRLRSRRWRLGGRVRECWRCQKTRQLSPYVSETFFGGYQFGRRLAIVGGKRLVNPGFDDLHQRYFRVEDFGRQLVSKVDHDATDMS